MTFHGTASVFIVLTPLPPSCKFAQESTGLHLQCPPPPPHYLQASVVQGLPPKRVWRPHSPSAKEMLKSDDIMHVTHCMCNVYKLRCPSFVLGKEACVVNGPRIEQGEVLGPSRGETNRKTGALHAVQICARMKGIVGWESATR